MLDRIKNIIRSIRRTIWGLMSGYRSRKIMGYCHPTAQINYPVYGLCKELYFAEYTRIQPWTKFIIAPNGGKVYWKKYSGGGINLTVITGNHRPTVGVPQFFLGPTHVNDVEKDVIVEEDVWFGANVTLLAGTHIGRGCILGACTLANKEYPPYAVLGGNPARIIAVKFSIDQIIEHEKALYDEKERFSKKYLEGLFEKYYKGMKVVGTSELSQEDMTKLDGWKKKYLEHCGYSSETRN